MANRYQKGFGTFQAILWFCLITIVTMLVFRFGPIYLENMHIRSIIKTVLVRHQHTNESLASLHENILKQLKINHIDHITAQHIFLDQNNQMAEVEVRYTVHIPLVANIDALVHFDTHIEAP